MNLDLPLRILQLLFALHNHLFQRVRALIGCVPHLAHMNEHEEIRVLHGYLIYIRKPALTNHFEHMESASIQLQDTGA